MAECPYCPEAGRSGGFGISMEAELDFELYETLRDPLSESVAKSFVRLLDAKVE